MKYIVILLSLGFVLLLSCSEEDQVSAWVSSKSIDSTFVEKFADMYIDSNISVGGELLLHPLSFYKNDAIRVRNQSGWGTFDAIATIYRDDNCNVQMITQSNSQMSSRGFQIQEYSLPLSKCDTIFDLINNKDFYELPFDLEPDRMLIDGNTYSIVYKGIRNKHAVTWQAFIKDSYGRDYSSNDSDKSLAEKIYHDVFRFAKRPQPCMRFYFDTLKQDSFVYLTRLDESHDYIDSVKYVCSSCSIRYSDYGLDTIVEKSNYDSYGNRKMGISYYMYTTEGIKLKEKCTYFIEPEEFD